MWVWVRVCFGGGRVVDDRRHLPGRDVVRMRVRSPVHSSVSFVEVAMRSRYRDNLSRRSLGRHACCGNFSGDNTLASAERCLLKY